MDIKLKGRIAEAKVVSWFVENGYDVYVPFSDCVTVDLIVMKDGFAKRVSVKYTSFKENQKYRVKLSNVSRKKDGSVNERTFDASQYDLLAVYIGPEDRVVVLNVDFTAKYSLAVF